MELKHKHKFDGKPYTLSNGNKAESWAYNETAKSVYIAICNKETGETAGAMIRKSVLKRLAELP